MSRFDVLAMGNALVDVLVHADDDFVDRTGVEPGAMTMIDAARSDAIYAEMGPAIEVSGGSAANTAAGVASFGGRSAYIGRVSDDTFGKVFSHDLRSVGVHFDAPFATTGAPTGRCLVIVTPDADRTMCTFLGAGAELDESYVDEALVESAAVTYLEGYVWDPPAGQEGGPAGRGDRAPRRPAGRAHAVGPVLRRTAPRGVPRAHRGQTSTSSSRTRTRSRARTRSRPSTRHCTTCEATARSLRSRGAPHGSVIVAGDDVHVIDARPTAVVDTTGAGDLFAAGFLYGLTHGYDLATCGQLGSLGAAEVISHLGARPAVGLAELARPILGA